MLKGRFQRTANDIHQVGGVSLTSLKMRRSISSLLKNGPRSWMQGADILGAGHYGGFLGKDDVADFIESFL